MTPEEFVKQAIKDDPNIKPEFKAFLFSDEQILKMAERIERLGQILGDTEEEPLNQFRLDLLAVDDVEEALMSGFAADSVKRMRLLTIEQVEKVLELKGIVMRISQCKKDHAAAVAKQKEIQAKVKSGQL